MKKITFLSLVSVFCLSISVNGQTEREADELFLKGNFETALDLYEELLNSEENALLHYRIGVCYLNTNIDKSKAIVHFEWAVKNPPYEPNTKYLLGRAYHFAYRFDDAIRTFQEFIKEGVGSPENLKDAGKQIEYCQNARELVKFPLNVKFENLGSGVNSKFPDFFPFVPNDERFIVFNTRRNDGSFEKENGNYYSNIYLAESKEGVFREARLIKKLCNPKVEEMVVGLSNSGNVMVVFEDGGPENGDLSIAFKKGKDYAVREKLPKEINTRYNEIAASISSDSSELYFASNMPGGFGGIDIYVCRRLPNGKWGLPQNLGPSVNTFYDEDFPSISPDGKTLFFSSKGHASMGGYDIFRAEFDEEKHRFLRTRNVGYPISTTDDDMSFRLAADGKYVYLSAVRPEGLGDLDIYRVSFENMDPQYSVIHGNVKSQDSLPVSGVVTILVSEKESGELIGEYLPNPNTMRYVMVLKPGKFRVDVEAEGFDSFTYDLEVLDKDSYQFEIRRDIILPSLRKE